MLKRIPITLMAIFLIAGSSVWGADKVYLKSGEVVKGKIVHESSVFVRIKTGEISTKEYLLPLIDYIERDQAPDTTETEDVKIEEVADPQPLMVHPDPEPLFTPNDKTEGQYRICSNCIKKVVWADVCTECGEKIIPFE